MSAFRYKLNIYLNYKQRPTTLCSEALMKHHLHILSGRKEVKIYIQHVLHIILMLWCKKLQSIKPEQEIKSWLPCTQCFLLQPGDREKRQMRTLKDRRLDRHCVHYVASCPAARPFLEERTLNEFKVYFYLKRRRSDMSYIKLDSDLFLNGKDELLYSADSYIAWISVFPLVSSAGRTNSPVAVSMTQYWMLEAKQSKANTASCCWSYAELLIGLFYFRKDTESTATAGVL